MTGSPIGCGRTGLGAVSVEPTTDRGDASGTGYWSPATGEYRRDLLRLALGREVALPRVAAPNEVVGQSAAGALLAPGTGDNMAAALGLGLGPGDIVVSLGTSGTVFGVAEPPPPTPPARSPASPTRPDVSFPWSARSTPPGFSTRPAPCSGLDSNGSTSWPWRLPRALAG